MSHQFKEFTVSLKIKLINSSPYYAQSNGQVEASNKIIIGLIKKKIEERSRRWHEVLVEALWAYRTSKHGTIKVTPFELVYGQEAVLSVELNLQVNRVVKQDMLSREEYNDSMMDEVDEVLEKRLEALRESEKNKVKIAKAYNKRVQEKSFQINDMVWKTILPLGSHDNKFGKWSSSWEVPFRVVGIVPGNAYFVETLEGWALPKALNEKYLKRYYPSIWQQS
jgi:hypothetical protein